MSETDTSLFRPFSDNQPIDQEFHSYAEKMHLTSNFIYLPATKESSDNNPRERLPSDFSKIDGTKNQIEGERSTSANQEEDNRSNAYPQKDSKIQEAQLMSQLPVIPITVGQSDQIIQALETIISFINLHRQKIASFGSSWLSIELRLNSNHPVPPSMTAILNNLGLQLIGRGQHGRDQPPKLNPENRDQKERASSEDCSSGTHEKDLEEWGGQKSSMQRF